MSTLNSDVICLILKPNCGFHENIVSDQLVSKVVGYHIYVVQQNTQSVLVSKFIQHLC